MLCKILGSFVLDEVLRTAYFGLIPFIPIYPNEYNFVVTALVINENNLLSFKRVQFGQLND